MCETCGCGLPAENKYMSHADADSTMIDNSADRNTTLAIFQDLLSENDHRAEHNRKHFHEHGVLTINLMSSPGAGKTNLIEATIESLRGKARIAVIEGDLETENDAARIRAHQVPAIQITTGSACHLDAHMVHNALHRLDLANIDILFIENVGNLVCPASFDLGQHHNVILLSVTEGDDKPVKYPVMFRKADIMLLTKTDLLPYLDDFDPGRAEGHLRTLANTAPVIPLSTRAHDRGDNGMDAWIHWLQTARKKANSQKSSSAGGIYPHTHSHSSTHTDIHSARTPPLPRPQLAKLR
uniref:Hydrogenase maturation factor HypB n=1 Tax=Candidatus Kentrum sp. TUN TaxID=2126343 RepID=A0A451AGY8_9GAMM|nr:MAG: Hydrogenase nickel incorporation protein HypB [Candidatus Kentron sp. TUN]VFK65298.1 MAG: Hydrogenase nickel incorporation protein HypB [Candidatus Kentron sp. TUN]VFK70369.1 MAG: Hydrogenase nickel incorporation protein HypB [Candidatus Kentron sp. TUN]